jgi:copper chaperone CopZ
LIEDLSMNVQKLVLAAIAALSVSSAQAATIEMTVNGLVCGFCAQGIEKTLRKNAATADVLVSLENRLVAIATKPGTDIPDELLRKALKDAGYDVKAIARTDRTLVGLREQMKIKQ